MAGATVEKVLVAVRAAGKDGVVSSDLVESLSVSKSSVTRAVNSLEREELVRRDGERVRPVLRRGRRLIATEERDEHALKLVADAGPQGLSIMDLAELLGVGRGLAYQSVYRLNRRRLISRNGETRNAKWVAAVS